jgi:hypothetical protein
VSNETDEVETAAVESRDTNVSTTSAEHTNGSPALMASPRARAVFIVPLFLFLWP